MKASELGQGRTTVTADAAPANGAQGAVAPPGGRYPTVSGLELMDMPSTPTPWLVPRFLPAKEVIVCIAHPKAGKTWIGVELGLAVAFGVPAFGVVTPTQTGPVLLWLAEDKGDNVKSRVGALLAGRNICLTDSRLGNLHVHARSLHVDLPGVRRVSLDLLDPASLQEFVAHAKTISPVLIVLDTMMSVAQLEDENSSAAMQEVMRCVRHIRDELDCTVLVTHHLGKDGDSNNSRPVFQRARGSSALRGAWDGAFAVQPAQKRGDETSDRFKVEFEMRGVEGAAPMHLNFARTSDGNGRAILAAFRLDDEDQVKRELDTIDDANVAGRRKVLRFLHNQFKKNAAQAFAKESIVAGVKLKAQAVRTYVDELVDAGQVESVPGKRADQPKFRFKVPAAPQAVGKDAASGSG